MFFIMNKKNTHHRTLFNSWWLPRVYDLWVFLAVLGHTRKLRENILRFVPSHPRVLVDLACGTGENSLVLKQRFPGARVLASDLSEGMLKRAQRKAERKNLAIEFSLQDATHTTYPAGLADCVAMTFALHDLPRKQRKEVAKEAWRLLKPGGVFVVYDYHHPSYFFIRIPLYIQFFLVENKDAWDMLKEDLEETFLRAGFKETKKALFYKGLAQIVTGRK